MKYSVVFDSNTGNTAMLAEKIARILKEEDCIYCGAPDEKGASPGFIFVGFWTDKGSCGKTVAEFLKTLHDKKVFLFGTAGFGGKKEYFEEILSGVKDHLDESNIVAGTYMCQGKMPLTVRRRYESLLFEKPEMQQMIDNFDLASTHPDTEDLQRFSETVAKSFREWL